MPRGYFGVAVYHPKREVNIGTLWRSAYSFGASFLTTIGRRYKPQCSDTSSAYRHVPLFEYTTFDTFRERLPRECVLVGVELHQDARSLPRYCHPERAVYLLGAEDSGLPEMILSQCRDVVQIPGIHCLNVAVAGTVVLYDRVAKRGRAEDCIHVQ